MIKKLLEALFRHKFVLFLPAVLIPAIVTPVAFLTTPPVYDVPAGIWIDHPVYLDYKDDSGGWNTPVQNQSARLNELLHTNAFLMDVAQRTSLAPLATSVAGQARVADLVSRGVVIGGTASQHLLVIHVQTTSARLSYELCKAIIDAYQDKSAADQSDQTSLAVQFYEGRVQDGQQQLNKASQDLRRYLVGHQTDPSQPGLPAAMLDPRLASLQSSLQTSQAEFNAAQSALTQAQQDAAAAAQGQQYGFQVLDPPQMPTAPTSQVKKIIVYPIAAAVVGLALSGLLLVMFVATDRSVRTEDDLPPGLRVLGSVPILKVKRVPKQLRSVATRRAIGAVAGTALPARSGQAR